MPTSLPWGHSYLLVDPVHFDVVYKINPYMDPSESVDTSKARAQWLGLKGAMEEAGGLVHVLANPPAEAPDMVFAMNLGYAGVDKGGNKRVFMSRMRHAERQCETDPASKWFEANGFDLTWLPDDASLYLEAGDQFFWRDMIVSGSGPRTAPGALPHLSTFAGQETLTLETVSEHAYHLDLAFCPLTDETAIVYPDAFTSWSRKRLLDVVPDPIVLTREEALVQFAANSIRVKDTVIMPNRTSSRVQDEITSRGLVVHPIDVSEFEKGGGSVRCMTNPLDFPLDGI